jgi:hypothetical protein
MNRNNPTLFALLTSLALVGSAFAAETPTDVIRQLTEVIRKGDRDKVAAFYATLGGKPPDMSWLDAFLASDDNQFVSPTWCLDAKIEDDGAVVVIATLRKRGTLDLDPCYLIRQDSRWRVLPKHSQIDVARSAVPQRTMKALEKVQAWFDTREKEIYRELEREAGAAKPQPQNADEAQKVLIKLLSKRDPQGFPTPRTK